MINYELGQQNSGFIELRVVEGHGSGYQQHQMLTERGRLLGNWNHPPVEFNKYEWNGKIVSRRKHPEYFESDTPGDNYLSGRAANALRDLWEKYGELLPVPSKDGEFYVFHCTNVLDALDCKRSIYKPIDPEVKRRALFAMKKLGLPVENPNTLDEPDLQHEAFEPDVIRGQDIFRVEGHRSSTIYVSQLAVDRVNSEGLKGFKFTPVWSEQTGPIVEEPTTVEQPRHGKTCKPMSQSTRQDVVDNLVAMAKKDLKIDVAVDPPEKVLERVRQEVQSAQGWAHRIDEVVGVGMVLSSLWGELVCREFGWRWAMVDDVAAVVSPTRSHVVFPHAWFHDLIRSGGRGPKISELYGMIKSGSLPRSEPESWLVLA